LMAFCIVYKYYTLLMLSRLDSQWLIVIHYEMIIIIFWAWWQFC